MNGVVGNSPEYLILLFSNYHTILLILLKATIKRYMSALSDDTITKFIGEMVFRLHAIW